VFIATVYFPLGTGQFLATTMTNRQQISSLFSNFTWISDDLTVEQAAIVAHWTNPYCSIFVNLSIYMVTTVSWDFFQKLVRSINYYYFFFSLCDSVIYIWKLCFQPLNARIRFAPSEKCHRYRTGVIYPTCRWNTTYQEKKAPVYSATINRPKVPATPKT